MDSSGSSSPPSGDEVTVVRASQERPPPSSGSSSGTGGLPGGRRRWVGLVVVLLVVAGVVTFLVLRTSGEGRPGPDAATSAVIADARPAVAGDAAADSAESVVSGGNEPVDSDGGIVSEPVVVSSDAGGVFTVTVFGEDFVLVGPPGGVGGALSAGEVESWSFDFEAGGFVAGDAPAAPFDAAIRPAARDYEIAWVGAGGAAGDLEAALHEVAAASGVHVGVVCDGASGAEAALACAETVVASDADAVILSGLVGEAAESALGVFSDASLPVVSSDVWHPDAVFVGANSYESGAVAGVNAGRHAQQAWDCAGIHILLGDVANLSGLNNPDLALMGFADGVRAVCSDDIPVTRIEATGSVRRSTVDWLADNPDVQHVVATSVTDDLTVDMSLALQQADRSGITAAPTTGAATAARLAEGQPAETRYLGATTTVPESYATNIIAALVDVLEGRPVPQEIHTTPTWTTHQPTTQSAPAAPTPAEPTPPTTPPPATDTPPPPEATPSPPSPAPTTPPSTTAFTAVSAGADHSCGVRVDGSVACWGSNYEGEVDAPGGAFSVVSAGGSHSCGVRVDGTVACWGYEFFEQVDAPGGAFSAVSAGGVHSCGVRVDGSVACWGDNWYGQVDAPGGAFSVVSASNWHSCGVRVDGTVACWGSNNGGQVDAPGGSFSVVSAGWDHACGVRVDGTVACWGSNRSGQVDAPGGSFSAVSAGYRHSCGVRVDGTVACWGSNEFGQVDAPGGSFSAVSAGYSHSCGVRTNGTIVCWNWATNLPEGVSWVAST